MSQNFTQVASQAATLPNNGTIILWKGLQALFWLIGLALLLFLIFIPTVGVTLFWNVLIPVAPALLVISTGVWRNVCPLGTTALFPDRFGISKKLKLSTDKRLTFNLIGIIILLLVIPLRHVIFDRNGHATAFIILALASSAFILGFIYERKSAWCSGLCPVHPVEKLYGSGVAFTLPNAHCNECVKCSVPCPDSTLNVKPFLSKKSKVDKVIELLIVGGFPGYVWGWFQVPDYLNSEGWKNLHLVYGYPIIGALSTICLYFLLDRVYFRNNKGIIISIFAAAAVSCYYWFRMPMLIGFGILQTNGTLFDLSNNLPAWIVLVLNFSTTGFFFWWMVFRNKSKLSWTYRPEYANK